MLAAGICAALWLTGLAGPLPASAAGTSSDRPAGAGIGYEPSVAEESAEGAALAAARASGEPVEVPALRGETREVFATPQGTLEAREYVTPVWTRSGGTWRAVDLDLAVRADGTVGPIASTVGLTFSPGGDTALVRLSRNGRELALSWPRPLPEPRLAGGTAHYPEILPGVELRLTAVPDGFMSLLVVSTPEAAAHPELERLRFGLATEGMAVDVTDDGGLAATDAGSGGTVFEAPTPLMWDSRQEEDEVATARNRSGDGGTPKPSGAEGPGGSSRIAELGVEVTDGGSALVLTPATELLTAEDTDYPVYIDPQWHSPRASAWTMTSKAFPITRYWQFNGKADEGLGNCTGWSGCASGDVKRLMYRMDTSRFVGTRVLSAEFVVRNVHSAQCTNHPVELWRTKAISSSTSWNTQNASGFWIERLRTESFNYGSGLSGCKPAGDAEFPIRAAVQQAADSKASTMTFGLRAGNETSPYHWKRFHKNAHLRVEYNRPPRQIPMSQLTMEYGGTCRGPSDPVGVRTLGQLRAGNVTDPDGDSVRVQIQVKRGSEVLWNSALTTGKASGSQHAVTMPGGLPKGEALHWIIRAYDGRDYGPWSSDGSPTGCYFVYDTTVPEAPVIGSSQYPASDPEDPQDPWLDGTGKYGTFTLSTDDSSVTAYRYGVNGDPHPANRVATTAGAPATVRVLPDRPGLHMVTAQALDAAGNLSEIRTYQFRIGTGSGERTSWRLDESEGAERFTATAPTRTATLHGGATTGAPGAPAVGGTALALDGTGGYAATDRAVVDTSGPFTVSAWARLETKPDHAAIVVTQTGTDRPGFELYYSATLDSWAFNQYRADAPDDNRMARVVADAEVSAGRWTHLVGSYDGATLRLYVDGVLAGSLAYTDAWDARGPVQIGVGKYGAERRSWFPGSVDEVQLLGGAVHDGTASVQRLYAGERLDTEPALSALAVFGLDEKAGATAVGGDAHKLPATPAGGVTAGREGPLDRAVRFDGTSGLARTSAGAVRTDRSFSVSAWARLERRPDSAAVVATQLSESRPGFELYYSATYDRWAFNQYSADSPDSRPVRAMQPTGDSARVGEWTHLLGVHDQVSDTLTLYVNGRQTDRVTLGGAWHATGPVQFGAGRYDDVVKSFFPGEIADVRIWDRVVTGYEAGRLNQQPLAVAARWMFEETGADGSTTPDAAGTGNALTLRGSTRIGDGFVDLGALELDGITGYADTTTVPADPSRGFTVAAWAQAAAAPDGPVTLMSAAGEHHSALTVRFVPNAQDPAWGSWQVMVPEQDTPQARVVTVGHSLASDVREWQHIAVSYDGLDRRLTLYVNGRTAETVCTEDPLPECSEEQSWADQVTVFPATASFQAGRGLTGGEWGGHWPGSIDDLWVFDGPLTSEQIGELAGGVSGLPTEVPGTP
ncbi:LamG-like jellyroll fold domain-containing protein [Streptomyces bacillaris]|uniref:LamG domain-containing protein n=1 Tax=Streptomyces bacillaris TaxID=68179 RepID=UPI0037FB3CE9